MEALPWGTITPSGLLLVVVWFVLRAVVRGDLVPRRTYEDVVKDKEYYRSAHERDQEQLSRLLPGVDAATRMIEAMVESQGADPKKEP